MVDFEQPASLSPDQQQRWNVIKQFRPLLTTMRVLTNKHLAPLFRKMLDEFDEALFEQSDKATTNVMQIQYFDLMRDVRKLREQVEDAFFQRVHQGCEHFVQGTHIEEKVDKDAQLSLVGHDHLDQSLAGKTVVSKALARYSVEISSLNQRFAVIDGGSKPGEDSVNLPSGPAHIVSAFEHAIQPLNLPSDVVLLVFELFDQHVMSQMATLYRLLNDQMIRANILPNLKTDTYVAKIVKQASPRARVGAAVSESASASASASAGGQPPAVASVSLGDQVTLTHEEKALFISISEMLASRRGDTGLLSDEISEIKAKREELVEALSRIQDQEQSISSIQEELHSIENFKDVVTEQIQQISSDKVGVAGADADTIDLVGMMFQFVLDDAALSDSIKTLLSHLHTPYLKVAILDKAFFGDKAHPARQLLNLMAKTAGRIQFKAADDQGIYDKVHATVDQIVKEFKDDIHLFELLLEDFQTFDESLNRRREHVEKRAIATVQGQEELIGARQKTTEVIQAKTQDISLGAAMLAVLNGPWSTLLVLTLLPKSKVSGRWDVCVAVIDEMVALHNKPPENWQRQLQILRGKVKKGLSIIGHPQAESDEMLAAMGQWTPPKAPESTCLDNALAELDSVETALQETATAIAEIEVVPEALSEDEQQAEAAIAAETERLKHLPFGTWFEFHVDQAERQQRVKLAWFSTSTLNFMFVNHAGAKVGIKPIEMLVKEMLSGQTRVVEEIQKPFVDRALNFVMTRLASERSG